MGLNSKIPSKESIEKIPKEEALAYLDKKLKGLTPNETKEAAKTASPVKEPDFNLFQEASLAALLKETDTLASKTIERVTRHSGYGAPYSSLYTIINGLNITGGKPNIPLNMDNHGHTFFTRPQLNLSYDNMISIRKMTAYADQRPDNMANAIRCMLQPAGFIQPRKKNQNVNYGVGDTKPNDLVDIRSDIVDDANCFIPLLSNTLMNFSGLPDIAPDTYTSKEGITKEQVTWFDDRPYQRNVFDITLNFVNCEGNVLTHLFQCWIWYGTMVAEATLLPFPINVMTNRIDYNTKIYRILLDKTRRYVQGVAATIAFPTAYPLGRNFDFNAEQKLNLDAKEVSVPFRCAGVEYDDYILIKEFNQLVARFNPHMRAHLKHAPHGAKTPSHRKHMPIPDPAKMVEITEGEKLLFNYQAYPFISESNEFLWYTPVATYNKLTKL